jgi:hypothetical protein
MSPEQLVAILVALTGVLTAVGILIGQVRTLRHDINGRLSDLVEATRVASLKEGELVGRDHAQSAAASPSAAPSGPAF